MPLFSRRKKSSAPTPTPYRFNAPENTAVITCCHVVDEGKPMLYVAHDADGDWQFLCGESHTVEDSKVISLKQATELDPRVNDLFEMPLGTCAERTTVDGPWNPYRLG